MRRINALIVLLLAFVAFTSACGDDDDGTAPSASTSSTSTIPEATTAAPRGVETVGELIDRTEAYLNSQPGLPRTLECMHDWPAPPVDRSEPADRGTVLYCGQRTDPPADTGDLWLIVLDDAGTVAWVTTSTEPGAGAFPFRAEPGLLCRELLANQTAQDMGDELRYTAALAYWFLEGEPARMDADRDGIPCEEIFPPEVVSEVWAGNLP